MKESNFKVIKISDDKCLEKEDVDRNVYFKTFGFSVLGKERKG